MTLFYVYVLASIFILTEITRGMPISSLISNYFVFTKSFFPVVYCFRNSRSHIVLVALGSSLVLPMVLWWSTSTSNGTELMILPLLAIRISVDRLSLLVQMLDWVVALLVIVDYIVVRLRSFEGIMLLDQWEGLWIHLWHKIFPWVRTLDQVISLFVWEQFDVRDRNQHNVWKLKERGSLILLKTEHKFKNFASEITILSFETLDSCFN